MDEFNKAVPGKSKKVRDLILSILFDAIGYISYAIPGIGMAFDFVWAPVSAFVLSRLYKGTMGKVGGVVVFIEELSPGFDFIPTFTICWFYKYIIKKHP